MKKKKLILIIIIVISLVIITTIAFLVINKILQNKSNNPETAEQAITKFNDLFTEKQDEYNSVELKYDIDYEQNGKCFIDAQIPIIKGNTETIQTINNEIKDIFVNKVTEVALNSKVYTIYNVEYVATEKDDKVSLMIKCILKSGNNPQRTIIKTYNYNVNEDRLISIEEILTQKSLDKQRAQDKLFQKIKKENEKNAIINEQGYNVYMRDLTSDIYSLDNMNEFYINKNENLYIIYAYGNQNNTSEIDVVTF